MIVENLPIDSKTEPETEGGKNEKIDSGETERQVQAEQPGRQPTSPGRNSYGFGFRF